MSKRLAMWRALEQIYAVGKANSTPEGDTAILAENGSNDSKVIVQFLRNDRTNDSQRQCSMTVSLRAKGEGDRRLELHRRAPGGRPRW